MEGEKWKDVVIVYIEGDRVVGNPLEDEPETTLRWVREFISEYKKRLNRHICTVVITPSCKIAWESVSMCEERLALIITDSSLFRSEMSVLGIGPTLLIGGVGTDYTKAIKALEELNKRDEKERLERETTRIT